MKFVPVRILSIGAVVALAAALAACSTTRSTGGQFSDAGITSKVKTRLAADPEVNPFNIDVDTDEGVVRLSGHVDDADTRAEAEKLARGTAGVRDVVNDIEIGEQTVGEQVDDSWIGSKVKAKIAANQELNPFNIDVDVNDGRVVLTGRVNSDFERDLAEEIARGVKNVRSVDNRLEVGKIDD